MPDQSLVFDAAYFAAAGLAFGLLTAWLRRDLRNAVGTMVMVVVVGLGGLVLLARFGDGFGGGSMAVVLRELALVLMAFGLIRVASMFAFEAALGKLGTARILSEVFLVVMLVVYGLYRMNASGVNLTAIITTSTVITAAIGFSLQATLGNLWGGIALQMDNTCRIGDWIRIDASAGQGTSGQGVSGQVISIRWRYLAVATNTGETVMIPNAQMITNRVIVLARRGDQRIPWRRHVDFSVVYGVGPSRVIAAVENSLRRSEIRNVASWPQITVVCLGFEDSGIRYAARYWLTELAHDEWTDSQVRVHVAAALARNGLEIPYPHRVIVNREPVDAEQKWTQELDTREAVLSGLGLFETLTGGERRALASELASSPFVGHDVVSQQGETAESLYVLAQGRVVIYREDEHAGAKKGQRTKLAVLEAPACFGEMGLLTGQARTATVIADGDVLCYRLDKPAFDAILHARPELADALSKVLAARQAANDATLQAASAEARARQTTGRAEEMLRRIRDFFGLTA
ncbi:MAG: mechanosensitive ion channel [Aromatoleum sp.]|nr:mechanosensitive ion channel [Aromatoleum sp.]